MVVPELTKPVQVEAELMVPLPPCDIVTPVVVGGAGFTTTIVVAAVDGQLL